MKFYNDIGELPIGIWFEVHNTGDVWPLCIKNERKKIKGKKLEAAAKELESELLEDAWEKMYNQYLDEFGVPDEMNAQIERLNNIAIMKADLIIENKTHLKTMIKVEETRLQMGESAKKKTNPGNESWYVGKALWV